MVLYMFNHKWFAEGGELQNHVHAFGSSVIRSACVVLVLTFGPQKGISVSSQFMTIHVALKIITLFLNTLGTSLDTLTFTAS